MEAPLLLTSPIRFAPGVGPRRAEAFVALGVTNIGRLIHTLPFRYEDEAAESGVSELQFGRTGAARGEVTATRIAGGGRKRRFEAVLINGGERLDLVWFNGAYLQKKIHPGMRLLVQGKPRTHGSGVQMANPDWEIIPDEEDEPAAQSARLRPIYAGSADLSTRHIESVIENVLDDALKEIEDHLPESYRKEREILELREAYRCIHRPKSRDEIKAAQRRLALDELLLLQLGVHMKREWMRAHVKAPQLQWSEAIDERIRSRIPFELTEGQNSAVRELAQDLQSAWPANRLIQGDVGSGKTVVALYAMLMATASKRQAAMMAPTELLAEQHYLTITELLKGSDVRVALKTGALSATERASIDEGLASGDIDLVIGTHALITDNTQFHDLAVVVIDEQHRFGVEQRAALKGKAGDGATPHAVIMTATPIPRTLAFTVFGDLDVSEIKGLPPGRMPVVTKLVTPDQFDEVFTYIRQRLDRGEQAYVVAPAIDSDGDLRDVRTLTTKLEEGPLKGKRIATLHGRMKRDSREHLMGRFRAGLIDVLVATTVIEVGVDVPNATMIVIDHAERFGMAQLHQLRGRVGRGSKRGLCVLMGDAQTPDAEARLKAVVETTDGFALAEKDLELRGPGELIGARQSGEAPFRVAEFPKHMELLLLARRDAAEWIRQSPDLDQPDEQLLRQRLMKAHGKSLGLVDVA